jgi:uncharacterized SAM-binding protein YcdF (DUF218 family)
MTGASAQPPRNRGHWRRWLLVFAILGIAASLGFISAGIVSQASLQELHSSDAIVVFGAAEYAGRPSPVFRARLDHALDLFQSGLAPALITTGGAGADPSFNEGQVGHDYLMHRGIPEASLIAETQSSDTAESAQRIAVIMRTNRMHSCIAVSDEYHVFRIRKLLEHEGLQVYVAPRPDSRPHSELQRVLAVLREAVSYLFWRLQTL